MTKTPQELATAAAARRAQDGRATWLRDRGWVCIPPEHAGCRGMNGCGWHCECSDDQAVRALRRG